MSNYRYFWVFPWFSTPQCCKSGCMRWKGAWKANLLMWCFNRENPEKYVPQKTWCNLFKIWKKKKLTSADALLSWGYQTVNQKMMNLCLWVGGTTHALSNYLIVSLPIVQFLVSVLRVLINYDYKVFEAVLIWSHCLIPRSWWVELHNLNLKTTSQKMNLRQRVNLHSRKRSVLY